MTVLAWILFGIWALASFFVFLTACKKYIIEGDTGKALEMFASLFFSIIIMWAVGHLASQGLLFW